MTRDEKGEAMEKEIMRLQIKISFLKMQLQNWKPKDQLKEEILELEKQIHDLKFRFMKGY